MCANLKMNQETIRVLLKKKKLKQTKANKNVLHHTSVREIPNEQVNFESFNF